MTDDLHDGAQIMNVLDTKDKIVLCNPKCKVSCDDVVQPDSNYSRFFATLRKDSNQEKAVIKYV